jgi:CDP-glycerol glycerophosphotransferase
LNCRFGGDWLLLPFAPGLYLEGLAPITELSDMDKLGAILAADAAVTSASGFPGEILLSGTPCFFYATKEIILYGLDKFSNQFDYPLAFNEKELLGHIRTYDETESHTKLSGIINDYCGATAGQAAGKVFDLVEAIVNFNQVPDQIYYRHGGFKTTRAFWKFSKLRWLWVTIKSLPGWVKANFIRLLAKAYLVLCRAKPIQENKILFLMCHNRYGCNPKYIIEEIIRRKLPFELTYMVNVNAQPNFADVPAEVRIVHLRPWWNYVSELSTAKVWIDNTIRTMAPKRPGQFFIQTFHGSLGIKKIDKINDNESMLTHNSITDFCISNSDFETKIYKLNGWRGVKIMEYGHPRNDILCPEAEPETVRRVKSKIYKIFNLEPDEKIVLYAPTFRDQHFRQKLSRETFSPESLACYKLDSGLITASLSEKLGGRWRFLFRLHYMTKIARGLHGFFDESAVDTSDYDDIQELMASSEVLISDYSSCLFDFILTRRPAFIFATDLAEYENDRGFYYSLRSTPFPIAESNEELRCKILNFDNTSYQEAVTKFLIDKGCREDGQASRRVVDLLESLMADNDHV